MSLLFGEIVEPTSRAFWDCYDESDEEIDHKPPEPEWKWTETAEYVFPEKIKLFLVIEGVGIKNFINSNILNNKKPTCQLPKNKVSIYDYPDENLIICLSEERELNNYGLFTTYLKPWIEVAENVITFSIQPQVFHKGHDVNLEKEFFIYGINSKLDYIKELEQPNFITGISAGVACLRQFQNLSSSCYIIYMKVPMFDSVSSEPILKLLTDIGIKCNESYVNSFSDSSNLYL